jgi:hypothetical protein
MKILRHLLALLAGLIFGFFLVVNSLFSDIFSLEERIQVTALVLGFYALLGFIFGYFAPAKGWRWAYWLCGFAFFFLIYFAGMAIAEGGYSYFLFIILYGVGIFGVTAGAGHLGGMMRSRKKLKG